MIIQKRYYKFKILKPNKEKMITMDRAINQFKDCTNNWIEIIDKSEQYPTMGNIHRLGYKKIREELPELYSETVQESMNRAIGIYRANGKSEYKRNSMSFKSRFVEINSHFINLPLLKDKHLWFPFIIPSKFKRLFSLEHGNVVLNKKDDDYFVYISFDVPCKEKYEPKEWFGIDLGINNILVLSDKNGKINKFFNGKHLNKIRNEFFMKRKYLQSMKSGDNNKWRALKTLSGKEKDFTNYINHIISKEVVMLAKGHHYGLALENLKGIRKNKKGKKFNRKLSSWTFFDLKEKIIYKAKEHGVPVKLVNPRNTSKICSKCGTINKIKEKEFVCSKCGLKINRDLNGARNIASIPPISEEMGFLSA